MEVISYDGWDGASTQSYYKYSYFGHMLPQDFLDAEISDFYAWRMPGSGWYSQTSVVGTTGKVYWMEAYSFNETEIVKALRRTINGDTRAPYGDNAYPANNATNVNVNTNIRCDVRDDGSGVERSSITMQVTDPNDATIPGSLNITGDFFRYYLEFNPTSSLPPNTRITVRVNAKDLFNNNMRTYQWQFTTGSTNVEPTSLGKVKGLFH